jgi:hypothetical protein
MAKSRSESSLSPFPSQEIKGAMGGRKTFAEGRKTMPGPGKKAFYLISSPLMGED